MSSIPIIDFSPFMKEEGIVMMDATARKEPTREQLQVAQSIDQACRNDGFLFLTNFGLDDALRAKVFAATRQLFALDEDTKRTQLRRITPHDNMGYAPFQSESLNRNRPNELKEAFNVRFPPAHHNEWNGCPADFQQVVEHELLTLLQTVAHRYALACALALGLPREFFLETLQRMDLCTVRFLHGPPCPYKDNCDAEGGDDGDFDKPLRVGEHTDFGAFTILLHADHGADGLQIKSVEGGEILPTHTTTTTNDTNNCWKDVVIPPGVTGAIVNTGAMLARWTNDHWKATAHRVIVPSAESANRHRYSMAFFVDPDAQSIVQVPDAILEGSSEGKKYPPISSSDYLAQKLQSLMTTTTG